MATQPVLGGTTLPWPAANGGYEERYGWRGADMVMASGAVATDLVTTSAKRAFTLRWVNLSTTDVATVQTAWATVKSSSATLTTLSGSAYTVTRAEGVMELPITWYWRAGAMRADVEMQLREV